jgi:hypothetical protein
MEKGIGDGLPTLLTGILTGFSGSESPGLSQVVESWGALPESIKTAILAIVEPYQPGGKP